MGDDAAIAHLHRLKEGVRRDPDFDQSLSVAILTIKDRLGPERAGGLALAEAGGGGELAMAPRSEGQLEVVAEADTDAPSAATEPKLEA